MPLSEFYRLAKGRHKSAQQEQQQQQEQEQTAAGPDPSSSLHGGAFVELLWENGQVMMKGQPNRVSNPLHVNKTRSSTVDAVHLPHHNSRFGGDKGTANADDGILVMMDSIGNDLDQISEHDDILPWFSYNMEHNEPVQHHKQSSDFFTEVSGVAAAESSIHRTSFTPSSECILPFKDSHHTSDQRYTSFGQRVVSSVRPNNTSQLDRTSSLRPKVSYSATQNILSSESAQKRCSSLVRPSLKMQTQDLGQRVPSSINFPHFAAIVKPGLDAVSAKANPEVPVTTKDKGKEKVSVPMWGELASPSQLHAVVSKSTEMSHQVGYSGNLSCQGSTRNIDVPLRQGIPTEKKMAAGNAEKTTELVVASSVCSANSVDRASNDPTYGSKRKCNESEDSEYPSEDIEEDSVDIKKAANNRVGSGSKRSRAAEVHNLSERRRRDRINEKMRALQELIPNCNKVDKASMLDEAIEYLKTLQLQVQMMSVGPGVCMPPMMLPHAAHMPRFSPMGIGMGYGFSMLDMNMNSSDCPSAQIQRFPMAQVSQISTLNAHPMPNLQMFGFQGQGVAMPMSHSPIRTPVDLNTTTAVVPIGNFGSAQISNSKATVHNASTVMRTTDQRENIKPDRAVALLKDDHHPSTSKTTEPSSKS